MTIVKICGIMDVPNGLAAIDAGADYLGFIFYPPSFRFLTVSRAVELIRELRAQRPTGWQAVGVFVNEPLDRVFGVQHACGLDVVQLNGEEDQVYIRQISGPVFKSVRFGETSPPSPLPGAGREGPPVAVILSEAKDPRPRGTDSSPSGQHDSCGADTPPPAGEGAGEWSVLHPGEGLRILLDANVPGMYGGTGVTYDWTQVRALVAEGFLAGGLSPENVTTALEQARPWGVDVSSGVERDKQKDPELIKAFLDAVRKFDEARGARPSPQPSPQRGEGVRPRGAAPPNSTDQAKPERMSVV